MNAPSPAGGGDFLRRVIETVAGLPRRTLLLLLWLYQRTLSPVLPVVSLGSCGCRFAPTCSHYAVEAIRRHGALAGTALAISRLLKCTPRHPGGFDPVPLSLRARPHPAPICRAAKSG